MIVPSVADAVKTMCVCEMVVRSGVEYPGYVPTFESRLVVVRQHKINHLFSEEGDRIGIG